MRTPKPEGLQTRHLMLPQSNYIPEAIIAWAMKKALISTWELLPSAVETRKTNSLADGLIQA